jgi:hypothetical protein
MVADTMQSDSKTKNDVFDSVFKGRIKPNVRERRDFYHSYDILSE